MASADRLSDAGLIPITASPAPYINPSRMEDGDGARVVGRVVGLQAYRHSSRQAEGVAERRHHTALAGDGDEILIAHQLADCRHHLRRETGRHGRERLAGRRVAEQPLAKLADGERGERREGRRIVVIDDQPGDLVAFVRDERFLQKALQGEIREHHLRRHALRGALRRHTGQRIARAGRARLGEQILEIGEGIPGRVDRTGERHRWTIVPPSGSGGPSPIPIGRATRAACERWDAPGRAAGPDRQRGASVGGDLPILPCASSYRHALAEKGALRPERP